MESKKVTIDENELDRFVAAMLKSIDKLEKISDVYRNYAYNMNNLVQFDATMYQTSIDTIDEIYKRLSEYYKNAAKSYRRSLEDLKDINARFAVLVRVRTDRLNAYQDFMRDFQNSHFAKYNYKPTSSFYQNAVKAERDSAERLYNLDKLLLETHKKYKRFQWRRIKSAWVRYSHTFTELYKFEALCFEYINKILNALKNYPEDPESIIEKSEIDLPKLYTMYYAQEQLHDHLSVHHKSDSGNSSQTPITVQDIEVQEVSDDYEEESEPEEPVADPNAEIEEFVAVKSSKNKSLIAIPTIPAEKDLEEENLVQLNIPMEMQL